MISLSIRFRRFLQVTVTMAATVLALNALSAPPTPMAPAEISARYVSDVTIPDGTMVEPGQRFTKTWRVRNSGSIAWSDYRLAFVSGDQMGGPNSVHVPSAAPGEIVDIDVPMIAPSEAGHHEGNWQILTSDGKALHRGDVLVLILVKGTNKLADLEPGLRDHSPAVRKNAVKDLAGFGPEAVPTLIGILGTDTDPEVRGLALAVLSGIMPLDRKSFQAVLAAIKDPDETVQQLAAMILITIVPKFGSEVTPELAAALTDPDPMVQRLAIQLLGSLGSSARAAIPALQEYVERQPDNEYARGFLLYLEKVGSTSVNGQQE